MPSTKTFVNIYVTTSVREGIRRKNLLAPPSISL
jgi:hypothetical protein